MPAHEHCSECDRALGKHRFVSADGQKILCGRCFVPKYRRARDEGSTRSRMMRSLRTLNRRITYGAR